MLYMMLNLTLSLTFVKFDIENNIRLENNIFLPQISNFNIDTSIILKMLRLNETIFSNKKTNLTLKLVWFG